MASQETISADEGVTKSEERRVFLFLVVCLAPILAVMLVGGYGFLIWMLQIIFGPPTA